MTHGTPAVPPIECEEDVDRVGLDIAREMVMERVMGWAKLGGAIVPVGAKVPWEDGSGARKEQ